MCSAGFSGTKNSAQERAIRIGAVVAAALLGDHGLHRRDSCRITARIAATVSMPASRVMVGGITARIHMLPSSSLGRNSVPSRTPRLRHAP